MIEVLISMFVLSVGLVTLASLAAQTLNNTAASSYQSLATTLASEKLEDLNRWPYSDPHVCTAGAASVGSLTTDVQTAGVTCGGNTDTVDYYDDVQVNDANTTTGTTGAVCETVSGLNAGVEQYTTTCHQADGTIDTTVATSAASSIAGTIAFHRRWTIEQGQPVAGVERITVVVTLLNGYLKPGVTYQMSTIRPDTQ